MLISLIYAFFYCCSYIATTGLDNGYFLLLDQIESKTCAGLVYVFLRVVILRTYVFV